MKKSVNLRKNMFGNQRGAVIVLVALLFILFIGFLAIAVDVNHLYVVRNELQNAADAGALAGAKALYEDFDPDDEYEAGELVNMGANLIAKTVGEMNASDYQADGAPAPVEINWTSGNTGDALRGHWSFANKKFTVLDTDIPAAIWGVPDADLDLMDGTYEYPPSSGVYPLNVNAVKVIARRNDLEAESFFAKIYGFLGFKMQAEAVAYIGFSGSLGPLEADVPIAICDTSLSNGDCNIGRMINSADNSTSNTAAWVDVSNTLSSEDECSGGTNAQILGDQIGSTSIDTSANNTACECINPDQYNPDDPCGVNNGQITGSTWLEAIGGQVSSGYNPMQQCFEEFLGEGGKYDQPWEMTLPVVKCDGGQVEGCLDVISAVTVNMVFMSDNSNPTEADTPVEMSKPGADNFRAWDAGSNCGFFYQLAGVDSSGNPIPPFYNAAELDNAQYNSMLLPDNNQSTVLKYLPETDFLLVDGEVDVTNDPWKIAIPKSDGPRWDGIDSSKEYTADMARWDCFGYHFNLKHQDGSFAPFQAKALYFLPDCEYHEPKGTTNGPNFGIRAKYPVLVD